MERWAISKPNSVLFSRQNKQRLSSWTQGCMTKDLTMYKDLPAESYCDDTQLLLAKAL